MNTDQSINPLPKPADIPEYSNWHQRTFRKNLIPADSLEDFAKKYRKHERYGALGEEYVQAILTTHREELEKYGITWVSHYDSSTGELVSWAPEES